MRRDESAFDLEAGRGLHDHHGLDCPEAGRPHLVLVHQQRHQHCLRYLHLIALPIMRSMHLIVNDSCDILTLPL